MSKSATIIALIRLAVLPLILFFYLAGWIIIQVSFFADYGKLIALILFVLVAVAEVLPNFIARKRDETITDAGKMWGRIATRLLMLVGLILVVTDFGTLAGGHRPAGLFFLPMDTWFVVLVLLCIFGRATVINSLQQMAARKGTKLAPDRFVRAIKVSQYIAIFLLMLYAFADMHHFFGLGDINTVVRIYAFAAVFALASAMVLSAVSACVSLRQNCELYAGSKPKKDWGETKETKKGDK